MSTLVTLLSVIVIVVTTFTTAKAGRLERIENNIKSIDHKLHAYSTDILILKNDVADTHAKLDLLLEIMNGTAKAHTTENVVGTVSVNDGASDHVSTLNGQESNIQDEIRRVRRAFGTEKKKLAQQQKRNNIQFLEFSDKLNDTLATLDDRHDTKWTLAADSINESVVAVLGAVRDEIDNQLDLWNQSIRDNLEEQANTTIATLGVLNHAIGSWGDIIQETVRGVDVSIGDLMNKSIIQQDNLTKTLQTKLSSSLTEINDTVRSIDYSNTLTHIVDSVQSLAHDTSRIFNKVLHKHDSVRLVDSNSRSEGRLEVFIDGRWGTVCDDSFTNTDATIVCKMLDYSSGIFKEKAHFGLGALPIVMDDVQCKGTEHHIHECTYAKSHNCQHTEDVGVICSP